MRLQRYGEPRDMDGCFSPAMIDDYNQDDFGFTDKVISQSLFCIFTRDNFANKHIQKACQRVEKRFARFVTKDQLTVAKIEEID